METKTITQIKDMDNNELKINDVVFYVNDLCGYDYDKQFRILGFTNEYQNIKVICIKSNSKNIKINEEYTINNKSVLLFTDEYKKIYKEIEGRF